MQSSPPQARRATGPIRAIENQLRAVSIRTRLILAFVLLLVLMLSVAGVGAWQMQEIERAGSGATAAAGIRLLLAVCVGGAAIQFVFCYLLTSSIVRPVKVAMKSAHKVGNGDLTVQVRPEGRDEVTQLFHGINEMTKNLRQLVSEVAQGANRVAVTSSRIAQGNQDLAQRTEEQASTLEETASSMEQLTATVGQNAHTAREASQMARSACDVARRGGEVVDQVVSTMDAISDASKKIADIIGVIDGIAFQTNILALNAAVEAARAGEQGRGFAVVAAEVRNLAARSAAAAKEIKGLIADSVDKVQAGGALVDNAGHTMVDVVMSVTRVSDLIAEIAAASQEQSEGILQVNTAVTQMDRVVQQNASLVDEAAASTATMSDEAAALLQLVARFRLGQEAAQAAAAAPRRPAAQAQPQPRVQAIPVRPRGRLAAVAPGALPLAKSRPAKADGEWQAF
jgi:methyl-accepting chemotaxis protein